MSEKKITEVVTITDHPLESFFDMESNSTEVVKIEQKTELIKPQDYDDKDVELEEDAQVIIDEAMSGYKQLQDQIEDIDPKYAARNWEVANQLLNTALAAVKEKAALKKHKDKLNTTSKTSNTTNTIIIDTNSLIQHLRKPKIIDVPSTDVTPIDLINNKE